MAERGTGSSKPAGTPVKSAGKPVGEPNTPTAAKVRFGLRVKFSLAIIALVAVVVVVMTIYFIQLESGTLKNEIFKFAEREIEHLANTAQDAIASEQELNLIPAIENIKKIPAVKYVIIFDANGRVIQHFDPAVIGTTVEDDEITRKAREFADTDKPLRIDVPDPAERGGIIYDFSKPVMHPFFKNRIATVRMGFSDSMIREEIARVTQSILYIGGFFLVFSIFGAIVLASITIKPIRKLSQGAAIISTGDLDFKIDIGTSDELGALARDFNLMTEHLKKAKDIEIESRIMQEQLELAKEIQEGLNPMAFYDRNGIQIKGYTRAAKGVGGDYFDYIDIGESKVGALISDVSGKGVPASLVMVMIRTVFTNSVKNNRHVDCATIVRSINDALSADFAIDKFATLFFMIYNRETGELSFTNAGHGPLFCYREALSRCTVTKLDGVPIGITEDVEYEQAKLKLNPGDVVVLYTDGITEMRNESREEYGRTRLQKLLVESHRLNAQEIVEKIVTDVDIFRGNASPHDDMTTLVMKRVS
ncbi:MAG: HAMP domain-containing protein [Spirochaetes bacterium]|nr:MAG: HAMP domain-containing protein [Spirochaetota bacterium]